MEPPRCINMKREAASAKVKSTRRHTAVAELNRAVCVINLRVTHSAQEHKIRQSYSNKITPSERCSGILPFLYHNTMKNRKTQTQTQPEEGVAQNTHTHCNMLQRRAKKKKTSRIPVTVKHRCKERSMHVRMQAMPRQNERYAH